MATPTPPPHRPVRWKQAFAIWIGMFPVNVTTTWVITMLPWWGDVALPARSAIVVSILAPLMTFIMMPTVTRVLRPWLQYRRDHARQERSLHAALDARAAALHGNGGGRGALS
ncbi:hypothetical protein MUN76_05585 [Leucobacter rhizosphaerae]|uniref:DUF2798 domain-containing protein n=1 Tax=Leucobacter rhizosphaerae TaxID=2932245 RepID=A0ABY4FYU4_9MICO|nr:hypothetical protein [Leucobacter rhizosphaerae]UOQ61442.1 hypothetical protein MUN76_05585 [Leucobacter rhizosphaerae]